MKKSLSSRVMLIVAMTIYGTLAPFVRRIAVSSPELALYRAVAAAILIGAYLLLNGQRICLKTDRKSMVLLLLSGAAMTINWIFLFEAYKYTTVAAATLSYYFAPVIVVAVCPLLFREKLSGKQILCFLMASLGMALIIVTGEFSLGGTDAKGIFFGLSAAVLYACVILLNKLIPGISGIQRTFLQFLAAIVVLIPYVFATGGITVQNLDGTGWLCLGIVGVVHTGFAYCLYFSALKSLPGQTAAILSYIDPLVAVIISVFFLGETLCWQQLVGGCLILGFTLYNECSPLPKIAKK